MCKKQIFRNAVLAVDASDDSIAPIPPKNGFRWFETIKKPRKVWSCGVFL
jgi:hypothetical protein